MKANVLFLAVALLFVASPALGQTIYQEGRGAFLRTTPITTSIPHGTSSYQAAGGFAYRLSRHVDVGASGSYQGGQASAAVTLGYTARLSETGWGLRPKLSAGASGSIAFISAGVGLFRQLSFGEAFAAFPQVSVAPVLFRAGGIEGGLGAGVAVPLYLSVWRNARMFVTPSYGVSLLPGFHAGNEMRLGLGAQLSF